MIKNLSQILITDGKEDIPPLIQESISNVRACFQDCKYTLYDNEKIIDLMKDNFDSETLKAYKKLKPYAYKSDLAKYCITYLKGGWYIDITIKFSSFLLGKAINLPENIDFLGFKDFGDGLRPSTPLSYNLQNSVFYSNPKNPIIEKAIKLVIENCKDENIGLTPVCPTGPGVLGRSLAVFGAKDTHIIGIFMPLTPLHENKNRSYILPDGTIFALHKNAWMKNASPADLSSFGFKSTNNYLKMWNDKDIYDTSIKIS